MAGTEEGEIVKPEPTELAYEDRPRTKPCDCGPHDPHVNCARSGHDCYPCIAFVCHLADWTLDHGGQFDRIGQPMDCGAKHMREFFDAHPDWDWA